jgi:hypothetical protein
MPQRFDIEVLEREAMSRTGLRDFGEGDWRAALGVLLESVEREARLTDPGRSIVHGEVIDHMVNRLEIQDFLEKHPEVREERIEAPLVLATLPRTGQTAAGWILDRDPANRSLLTWYVKRPCPPPLPGSNAGDPRIAQARAVVAAMPEALRAMHLSDAEEPDECHWLLSNAFKSPHQIYSMYVPTHYAWARDRAEMSSAYAYYRLQLQLLQSRTPGRRWVLKNSPHLLHLDALHAALPDARFVQLHRDPLAVLASNCRLTLLLRRMRSDHVDPREIGASILQLLRDYVDRLLRFRDEGASRPWIDVRFDDFVADPLREVERIYEAAGIAMTHDAREGMTRWIREHPRDPRPPGLELGPFGIDANRARAVFSEYLERFRISSAGARPRMR